MIEAIGYIRVSGPGQTVENQRPAIIEYCERQGWHLRGIIEEEASAAKQGHQKQFARLQRQIVRGTWHVDKIVVVALDRLSREGPSRVFVLMDTLRAYGCAIASIREPWTDSPFNEPMYALVSWYAKWESQVRSERVRAGHERVRNTGTKSGVKIGGRGPDKAPRRRAGYLERWRVNKYPGDIEPNVVSVGAGK